MTRLKWWALLVVGCGAAAPYGHPVSWFLPEQRVTGRGAWLDVAEAPHRYRTAGEAPLIGPYYILLSQSGMWCQVDGDGYARAMDGALFACRWHYPRGSYFSGGAVPVIILSRDVLTSMSWMWLVSNWGCETGDEREILGCLRGRIEGDSAWVESWSIAEHLQQLRRAVGGDCRTHHAFLGTWHNHPYDADTVAYEHKTRRLSLGDLATFAGDTTLRVLIVLWDFDSLDAAMKAPNGRIIHPVDVVIQ